jgi:hypothetical protein
LVYEKKLAAVLVPVGWCVSASATPGNLPAITSIPAGQVVRKPVIERRIVLTV